MLSDFYRPCQKHHLIIAMRLDSVHESYGSVKALSVSSEPSAGDPLTKRVFVTASCALTQPQMPRRGSQLPSDSGTSSAFLKTKYIQPYVSTVEVYGDIYSCRFGMARIQS